jgi:hypothetical protein
MSMMVMEMTSEGDEQVERICIHNLPLRTFCAR